MLSELLGQVALGDIGLSALVTLFVLAVLTGRLVPKSTLDKSEENARAWRESSTQQQAINLTNSATLSQLLDGQRVTTHALTEIQAAGAYALAHRKGEAEK